MAEKDLFLKKISEGYAFKGEAMTIGVAMLNGEVVQGAKVAIPLEMMNRHGLIAGATGTGKTKTVQMLSETLSDNSVPVLVLDIKGDLSGLAMPGEANEKISSRAKLLALNYSPTGYPVELLTLSEKAGVRLRATVSEFGPVLLSKILGLNDTTF